MNTDQTHNRRIASNTIALYIRNLLGLIVGLISMRIVLKTLGEEDYGIYNVVAGSITFLTFISSALSLGGQRFLSYSLGQDDNIELKRTFSATFSLYTIMVIAIIAGAESIGVWFINNKLNIPESRVIAANIIFQFVIISTGITLLANPFQMAIMAREHMHIFAKVAVIESIVKILVCIALIYSPTDKLISYVFLLLISTFLVQSIYFAYARKKFTECQSTKISFDKPKLKEITSFSLWNLFGALAGVGKTQGVGVILNIFFGPVINAAHGVASTIKGVSGTFSGNFSSAISPQIVKRYASNNYKDMSSLLHSGSKMTFYLMLIVVVPLFLCIDFILDLWIGNHSDYMTTFCRLLLLESLIDSISYPLATANQATGKIGLYQALIGFFGLLNLPIAYILLWNGYPPESVFILSVILQICIVGVRIYFLEKIYKGAIMDALKNIIVPCTIVTIIVLGICYFCQFKISNIITCIQAVGTYIIICCAVIFIFGLTRYEKKRIRDFLIQKFNRK